MDEPEKKSYLEEYEAKKKKGIPFFPDALFKDAVISLVVFLALVALAYFVGAPLEAQADPADSNYTPRPEWYFLFLFQMLKYFPGNLEVIGVFVIPTLVILALFALPFLDRSPKRHFLNRPWVSGVTVGMLLGILGLTVLSVLEAPPPAQVSGGDQVALLYTQNCAPCHGPSIDVPAATNLHAVIAEGLHEGMPAWSADLTSDEIDALAGFVLSPAGSRLFDENCSQCHQAADLVAGDPLQLKSALEQSLAFPAHAELEIPDWSQSLSPEARTSLLNFLVAPDGQRLYAVNCAVCHGRSVAFSGEQEQLRDIIAEGGLHLEMPPWRERLTDGQLNTLAQYVVEPTTTTGGEALFNQYCDDCHGQRIPAAQDVASATRIIAEGGSHETMPVWGQVLTNEQLDALASYTFEAARGAPLELGQQLFAQNCAACHGDFGEGGLNPARADDVIAPISSAEYLKTRDDGTLRAIISQGQPNFGMSPFASAFGGPLDGDEIDAIVAFMRTWESNPPVELPPEVAGRSIAEDGAQVYADVCAQCHGPQGEGGVGPALRDPDFQAENSDREIFNTIDLGHEATAMIAWGEVLTSSQIEELVAHIRSFSTEEGAGDETAAPTFNDDVLPIFAEKCAVCHGSLGGWDGSSYEAVMNSGNNAPVVIPGDPENSLLAQKLLGTHEQGTIMPPAGALPQAEIQIILDWIAAGALE